jgi:PAN domain
MYEFSRPQYGFDNNINPINGDGFGGYGPPRPLGGGIGGSGGYRCDEADSYRQVASRHRMRSQFIKRAMSVPTLVHCQRECTESRDFTCRSFNYRESASNYESNDRDREASGSNCELSDRDSREMDIQSPVMFDVANYDFYEKSPGRAGYDGDCLDVSQVCSEDGMEFTLRTPEGFVGRIYSYGYYDRCFFRGTGGTINVLRLSGPQGYPECGTQRVSVGIQKTR